MPFKLPICEGVVHLPKGTGRYTVGCIDVFTVEHESKLPLLFRLYYPSSDKCDSSRWPLWLPDPKYAESYVEGNFQYSPAFKSFLINTGIYNFQGKMLRRLTSNPVVPVNEGSKPDGERFPVVIFSHMLSACRTTYSFLCTDIASQGYYVAALEHGDNSASIRMMMSSPDSKISWRSIKTLPKGANETELRARQLKYRTSEVSQCLDSLVSLDNGILQDLFIKYSETLSVNHERIGLESFKGKLEIENCIIAGHCMGGCTTIRTLSLDARFKGGVAIDSWMYPVRKDEIDFDKKKLLFVNMEKWQFAKNLKCMVRYESSLAGELKTNVVSLKNDTHYSPTDHLIALQNCFLGKIVAGVLGKPDPDFSSFQNLLAISELVHGWIKNRLCAETETYLTTCRKYKGRVLYGIKTPEE
ncbi:platelet-activating factor acetylhydrolase [Eurytemora carolleeae]|uniref:platelet-activating factor acetylhydrolase n=1 Tax=Eurytemora carolleeae TaxID=1294199 RepID=UPI000C763395|nr:platelet-activating factor acetylhydrolase [Eurytemora carolleeae]|eukprot:XP_023326977.1 platelet-activating factor acetylhydrolase-like [Eurytemora affinis]